VSQNISGQNFETINERVREADGFLIPTRDYSAVPTHRLKTSKGRRLHDMKDEEGEEQSSAIDGRINEWMNLFSS